MALAKWGMWLSVLFGLGYVAFYAATYFAIRSDANEYTMRWFDLLKKGKQNQAFLHVLEPNVRQTVNPDDEKAMDVRFNPSGDPGRPGPLTVFRTSELIRLIQFGRADTQITPLGIREWEYNNGKYRIKRIYEISSPEGSVEVAAVVSGSASTKGEYEGREWMVMLMDTNIAKVQDDAVRRGRRRAKGPVHGVHQQVGRKGGPGPPGGRGPGTVRAG